LTVCCRINDKGQPTVPQFSIKGEPAAPEVLSNKVILTQPSPGNARGAVWADNPNKYREWVADVDFRVNGPERGGGNLNIWLAKRGAQDIGTASIYKVGKFDGLALVIDRSGGGAGMVRGFLNDGSTDYSTHHSVDSLAFGHCDYSYRNLGRPSQIKLRQSQHNFRVEVDSRLCFETDKISLPPGYHFGITAASAENPDSFEIFKLVVMTEDLTAQHDDHDDTAQHYADHYEAQHQFDSTDQSKDKPSEHVYINRGGQDKDQPGSQSEERWTEDVPDTSADAITSSKAQFADLHNRLQSVNHHLSTIFHAVAAQASTGETRHAETSELIHDVKMLLSRLDKLDGIQTQVSGLESEMKNLRGNLQAKIRESENNLKKLLGESHGNMLEHVAVQASPKHGKLIFVIIGSQIVLVAAYIFYERKKTMPKKYL
jgi:mannose-binding lectin 1